jgi:hypothetical protein
MPLTVSQKLIFFDGTITMKGQYSALEAYTPLHIGDNIANRNLQASDGIAFEKGRGAGAAGEEDFAG